jgi:hypothetical protein
MKTYLALLALLAMGPLPAGAAASLDENRFGLYYDQAATIDEIDIAANSQQVLYLVLINPVNGGGNVTHVGGFECAVRPASGDFLLGVTFPLDALNINGTPEDMVVAYNQGLPVTAGGGTTLATLSVLTLGNNPEGYYLEPATGASIPNSLVYLDMGGSRPQIVDALPVSGSFDLPVFTFGDYSVDEEKNWGGVKSLYR